MAIKLSIEGNTAMKPKVSLISYTGFGHPDPLYAGRLLAFIKNTRLEQNAATLSKFMNAPEGDIYKELRYIAGTIRSSWEFVDYTFQISDVSRSFTHQLVRTRTASYAQQTQRIAQIKDIRTHIPDSVTKNADAYEAWCNFSEAQADTYDHLIDCGIPPEDAREMLMTGVLTNIAVKMNLRTLADVCGKRKNMRAQGQYEDVVQQMRELVYGIHPWTTQFLEPERTATPHLDALLRRIKGGDSIFEVTDLPEALKEIDMLKGVWG